MCTQSTHSVYARTLGDTFILFLQRTDIIFVAKGQGLLRAGSAELLVCINLASRFKS